MYVGCEGLLSCWLLETRTAEGERDEAMTEEAVYAEEVVAEGWMLDSCCCR